MELSSAVYRYCCQLVSLIAKLRCFAVSYGAVHNDSSVREVGFEGSRKGGGCHDANDHSRGNDCALSGRLTSFTDQRFGCDRCAAAPV